MPAPDRDGSWSTVLVDGRTAHVVATERSDGDFAVGQSLSVVDQRRRSIVDAPWTWLRQVHGSDVVVVGHAGDRAGSEADAAVTVSSSAPICVQTADCAPVAFVDPAGVIGVAHAGWRGLVGGVLQATVSAMATLGAQSPLAVLGPCVRPASYAFSPADLDAVAAVLGDDVRSRTSDGSTALDVPAAVHSVLAGIGVEVVADIGGCTAAQADRRWSHRARGERERQTVVAWIS